MRLSEIGLRSLAISDDKGLARTTFPEFIALVHSELSEALEEYRDGHAEDAVMIRKDGRPHGIPIELADVLLRVLERCAQSGIDIDEAVERKIADNLVRPPHHNRKWP